jgi:class 3 adenylate cyclase
VGDCSLLHVGGIFKRAEYFCIGEALSQALSAEEDAVGGDIIVSKEVWQLVKDNYEGNEIPRIGNYKITKLIGASLPPIAYGNIFINSLQKDDLIKAMQYLKNFVPNAIMPYIEVNMEEYCGETRKLSVMFASLGVDLSSAKTPEGMNKIQKIVTTIQKVVYRMEGSLNKLVMDDKGSTLICVWGLPPMAHEDDATRSVLAAQMIRSKLKHPDINVWCCIGISTGTVFSGVVGTSGSRKEFSVLGDVVNVSARIMGWSKKEKGKIYVCINTMKESSPFINFDYVEH